MVFKVFRYCVAVVILAAAVDGCGKGPAVFDLRTDFAENPTGIDDPTPQLSWETSLPSQNAYRVRVSSSSKGLGREDLIFDSGKTLSDRGRTFSYPGNGLEPCSGYYWDVTVWDGRGRAHTSAPAYFETGLMGLGFGKAQWISAARPDLSKYRTDFRIDFDFVLAPGSKCAAFVLNATDEDNYRQLSFDFSSTPSVILLACEDGETRELGRSTLGAGGAGLHHVTVKSAESLTVEADGRKCGLSAKGGRIGYFGFHQGEGQEATFSNISVTEDRWNTLLYSDSSKRVIKGDGSVSLIRAADEISAPMMRRSFTLTKKVQSVRLYSSARGIYGIYVNGHRLNDKWFSPGWTDYAECIPYDIFDITRYVTQGSNGIGVMLGSGWLSNIDDGVRTSDVNGIRKSFIAMICIDYKDGTSETVYSNKGWSYSSSGPVVENSLYGGEDYNAGKEISGWSSGDFDDVEWEVVEIVSSPDKALRFCREAGHDILESPSICAKDVQEDGEGGWIYDFGGKIYGVERLSGIPGQSGQKISVRFSTDLNAPSRPEDNYIIREPGGSWNPRFTCHTFRYLHISGLSEPLPLTQVEAIPLEGTNGKLYTNYTSIN